MEKGMMPKLGSLGLPGDFWKREAHEEKFKEKEAALLQWASVGLYSLL